MNNSFSRTSLQHARELLRYLGPGILVTVGFIDPGNWASNVAAGADYGYLLLWMAICRFWMSVRRSIC